MTSENFAEKIRELEAQGQRLMSASATSNTIPGSLSESIREKVRRDESHVHSSTVDKVLRNTSPDRSFLRDQMNDQRSRLDSLLQQDRASTVPLTTFNPGASLPIPRKNTSPTSTPTQDRLAAERHVREANARVDDMKKQLDELHELCAEQKKQFRSSNEELNRRLQDLIYERDRLLAVRADEASGQDDLIMRLQDAVQDLHGTTQRQASTLLSTQGQIDTLSIVKSDHESMVTILRGILQDAEKRRGKAFYESESIDQQSSTMLLHTMERFIEETEQDSKLQSNRIAELELQIADLRSATQEIEKSSTKSAEERIQRITSGLEDQLKAANERASNSRQQSTNLRTQLDLLQDQLNNSEQMKDEQVKMLEERIACLKDQMGAERREWGNKLESVSVAMDQTQRDLSQRSAQHDDVVQKLAAAESRAADFEVIIDKLSNELELERDQTKKLWDRDNNTQNRNVEVETKMAMKDMEMARLEQLVRKTKDECEGRITQEVALAEKYQQEKSAEEKSILVQQVDTLSQRHAKTMAELQTVQVECSKLTSQLKDSTDRESTIEKSHNTLLVEKETLQNKLLVQTDQFNKVCAERDEYFGMIEQRNDQLSQVKVACENQAAQREERERSLANSQETINGLKLQLDAQIQSCHACERENGNLLATLAEQQERYRESETQMEKLNKKLRNREKKLADAESDKKCLEELLVHRSDTMQCLESEVREAQNEAREFKREMDILTEERNALKSVMKGQEGEMQREINNLLTKLKAVEHDYKLTKKALKTKDNVDENATSMANKLQLDLTDQRKITDDLRTKLRWLEEKLDMTLRERKRICDEKDNLEHELTQSSMSHHRLKEAIISEKTKCTMLEEKVESLEDGLKHAISRCASLQDAAQKSEQDVYKLKLKHQLDLKELTRPDTLNHIPAKNLEPVSPIKQDEGLANELKVILGDMKNILNTAAVRNRSIRNSDGSITESYQSAPRISSRKTKLDSGNERRRSTSPLLPKHRTVHKSSSVESISSSAQVETSSAKRSSHSSKHTTTRKSKRRVSEPLTTEAQVLCQNLEKKLANLARMGSKLQQENDGIKESLGSQDKKPSTSAEKLHRYLRSQV